MMLEIDAILLLATQGSTGVSSSSDREGGNMVELASKSLSNRFRGSRASMMESLMILGMPILDEMFTSILVGFSILLYRPTRKSSGSVPCTLSPNCSDPSYPGPGGQALSERQSPCLGPPQAGIQEQHGQVDWEYWWMG